MFERLFNRLLTFEHKHKPLASWTDFLRRLGRNLVWAAIVIAFSLLVGMAGYVLTEDRGLKRGLADAYLSAAMILSGMGPVREPITLSGKLFAGTYALYSGLVLVVSAGIILAPVLHRFLHYLHVEDDLEEPPGSSAGNST